MSDPEGIPVAVIVSGANEHDINFILPLVFQRLPVVGGKRGRPYVFPKVVRADCGYTSRDLLYIFRETKIKAFIPQRGEPSRGLGKLRWPVERTISWLKQFRRVGIRRERRLSFYEAFVSLAFTMICYIKLTS
jgi:transposase